MVNVKFFDNVPDELLDFVVIVAKTQEKYVIVKHKERTTWEIPGGHREIGETILEAAKRELREETGATKYTIEPVCVYLVEGETEAGHKETEKGYGMVYYANIDEFEEFESEIEKIEFVDDLDKYTCTYPELQSGIIEEFRKRGFEK